MLLRVLSHICRMAVMHVSISTFTFPALQPHVGCNFLEIGGVVPHSTKLQRGLARGAVYTTCINHNMSVLPAVAGAGVDIGNIQRLDAPTRDVYVVRTEDGDREFAGFGLPTDQYADAFIDKSNLPLDKVKVGGDVCLMS